MGQAPGYYVRNLTSTPARGVPTDTGTWFAVGAAERGPTDRAVTVRSMAEFTQSFGKRVSQSLLADSIETFFGCGGAVAVVARAAGPAVATAQKVLNDSGAVAALTVKAANPGAWGNGLAVQVLAGSTGGAFVLVVTENGVEVERSGDLATTADAAAWSLASGYVRVTATGANDPAVAAAAALTGGADDFAGITNTQYATALALFTRTMGAGQVSAPGVTTATVHAAVMAHAEANNRVALLDQVDSGTAATLVSAVASDKAASGSWTAKTYAQWATVRGVVAGTTRTVPYSAVDAGLTAAVDNRYPWGNRPAAGDLGVLPPFVVGITQRWTDQDRATLNDAGVVAAVDDRGQLKTYGIVGLGTGVWRQHHTTRVRMRAQAVMEDTASHFVFRTIDGRGETQAEFAAALRGRLMPAWEAGALYGDEADEAFTVDTGDAVNTLATKAAGQLNAAVGITLSPDAETVTIDLTSLAAA